MKRILTLTLTVLLSTLLAQASMSNSKVRKETRFLTDKMAYELNLSTRQYDDVYEINYDFISSIRYLADDICRGYAWAQDRYYEYLDLRNDDLRWVLDRAQYNRFMHTDYFFRPAYLTGRNWAFRVRITYTRPDLFYFPKPAHYASYCGAHCRRNYQGVSYYSGRYTHPAYHAAVSLRKQPTYENDRRADFGGASSRPSGRPSVGNPKGDKRPVDKKDGNDRGNGRGNGYQKPSNPGRDDSQTRPANPRTERRESQAGSRPSGREGTSGSRTTRTSTGTQRAGSR